MCPWSLHEPFAQALFDVRGSMMWEGLNPPYRTIVADPPWPIFGPYVRGLGRRYGAGGRRRRATSMGYSLMSIEEITELPVTALAAPEGAALFLWVPAGFNREGAGVAVARAWGFKVIGEIVWDKINYGLGAFPRPQHEVILVCRRGTLAFPLRDVPSVQRWSVPRARNNGGKVHSAKPPAAYDLFERAAPGPYVDLFARQPRFGWDSWGHGYEEAG